MPSYSDFNYFIHQSHFVVKISLWIFTLHFISSWFHAFLIEKLYLKLSFHGHTFWPRSEKTSISVLRKIPQFWVRFWVVQKWHIFSTKCILFRPLLLLPFILENQFCCIKIGYRKKVNIFAEKLGWFYNCRLWNDKLVQIWNYATGSE